MDTNTFKKLLAKRDDAGVETMLEQVLTFRDGEEQGSVQWNRYETLAQLAFNESAWRRAIKNPKLIDWDSGYSEWQHEDRGQQECPDFDINRLD